MAVGGPKAFPPVWNQLGVHLPVPTSYIQCHVPGGTLYEDHPRPIPSDCAALDSAAVGLGPSRAVSQPSLSGSRFSGKPPCGTAGDVFASTHVEFYCPCPAVHFTVEVTEIMLEDYCHSTICQYQSRFQNFLCSCGCPDFRGGGGLIFPLLFFEWQVAPPSINSYLPATVDPLLYRFNTVLHNRSVNLLCQGIPFILYNSWSGLPFLVPP